MINEKKLRLAKKIKVDKEEEQAQQELHASELEKRYDEQIKSIKTSIELLADALQVSVDFPDIQPLLTKLVLLEQLPDSFADIKNMSMAISSKLEKINGHLEKKQVISVRGFAEANMLFKSMDRNIEKFADLQTYLEQLTNTLKQGQEPTDFKPVRLVIGGDGLPLRYLQDMPTPRGGGGGGGGQTDALTDAELRASAVQVTGTVTVNEPVTVDGSVTANPTSIGTASVTSVNDSASSQTLKAANSSRLKLIIYNDSTVDLYVKLGGTASTTDFSVKLLPGATATTQYTGAVHGIWASDASGAARLTELTA